MVVNSSHRDAAGYESTLDAVSNDTGVIAIVTLLLENGRGGIKGFFLGLAVDFKLDRNRSSYFVR